MLPREGRLSLSATHLKNPEKMFRWVPFLGTVVVCGWLFLGVGTQGCTPPPQAEKAVETVQEPAAETVTDGSAPESTVESNPDQAAILKPQVIASISPEVTVFPLPDKLQGKEALFFASISGGDTLVGSVGGFYTLKDNAFTLSSDQIDVVGLAAWTLGTFAIAAKDRIYLWDGAALQTTLLHQQLEEGAEITAISAYAENSLWIGTKTKLWRLENERLLSFEDVKGVKSLLWVPLMKTLLIKDGENKDVILRQDDIGQWQQKSFDGEGLSLLQVLPASRSDYWGITAQGLWLRKQRETSAAWWPYRLSPNDKGEETISFKQMAIEGTTGFAWVFADTELFRLEGEDASKMARPAEMGAKISLTYTTEDGSLWVADQKNLLRIGQATASITYSQHVAPFISKSQCLNCHAKVGGQAFPLETYDEVKPRAQRIVDALKATPGVLAMPPAGYTLVGGDAALIERWIKDGLKE